MSESPFSTEDQQYTIDVIIGGLRGAYVSLFDRKKELELMEQSEEVKELILVINLRLDILGKVETKLLAPIKEEYAFMQRISVEGLPPEGALFAMMDHRQSIFVNSIMQGLKL